jgi:hypothetical protein
MTSHPAPRQRLGKLGLLALLCALPFLIAIVYLERQVESIDTLPVDEYKDLTWGPDGRSLLLLHRPLIDGADSELWSGDPSTSEFTSLGRLPADKVWRLTGRSVDGALVLGATADGKEKLAVVETGVPKFLDLPPEWSLVPSQGEGLFFSKVVDDVPFEQMVEVEDAPEVEPSESNPAAATSSPGAPLRSGVQIGRYNRSSGNNDLILTIPFNRPEEQPRILLTRESPDKRFLALVTQFGEMGTAGVWIYDSEASRLLWTRIVVNSSVAGLDWSPSSVALSLCDGQGVVILDNVLNIESTRYEVQGLGSVVPLFAEEDMLYLVGASTVHRLDRQAGQAEMVFDSAAKGVDAKNFVVNPSASRAAFFSSPLGFLELSVYSLDSPDDPPVVSKLPGSLRRLAQGTLTYQVGDALRTAWRFWKP